MDSTLFYANLNFRLSTPGMQLLHLKDHPFSMLIINVCELYTILFMSFYFMFISLATAGWIGLVGVLPAAVAIWSGLELRWKTNHNDIVPRLVAEG